MFNIQGTLTQDPFNNTTTNGTAKALVVLRYIGASGRSRHAEITLWGDEATAVLERAVKGTVIKVIGELDRDLFTPKGSDKKRSKAVAIASYVELIDSYLTEPVSTTEAAEEADAELAVA